MNCINQFELIQLQGLILYQLTADFTFACNSFSFVTYNRSSQKGKSGLTLHRWLVTARHVADANSQNQFTARLSVLNASWYMKPRPH